MFWLLILGSVFAGSATDPMNPYNLTDCRNQTAPMFGDDESELRILSWHIHYTTNSSDQERFYDAMVEKFSDNFSPSGALCPFGPNYGLESYPYVCSLESSYEEKWAAQSAHAFNVKNGISVADPWNGPQRAFFFPDAYIEEAWEYAQDIQGYVDILRHPNSGCMHDDHTTVANGGRGLWVLANTSTSEPTINVLEFPCNMPATGCNDTIFSGPPSCGCDTPLNSDAPEDSCENCLRWY